MVWWEGPASPVMEQTEPVAGHRLAIGRLEDGDLVLEDLTNGQRLGPLDHSTSFAVEFEGRPYVVLAGVDELAKSVTLEWGQEVEQVPVQQGVWMSRARPHVPGQQVSINWHHGDGHLRFTTIEPLRDYGGGPNRPAGVRY